MEVVVMYRKWETQQVPIINRTGKHEALRMQHKSLPEKAMQDDRLIVKFSQLKILNLKISEKIPEIFYGDLTAEQQKDRHVPYQICSLFQKCFHSKAYKKPKSKLAEFGNAICNHQSDISAALKKFCIFIVCIYAKN